MQCSFKLRPIPLRFLAQVAMQLSSSFYDLSDSDSIALRRGNNNEASSACAKTLVFLLGGCKYPLESASSVTNVQKRTRASETGGAPRAAG